MLTTLIDYAALVLAFAAGIHWGFELQAPHQNKVGWAGAAGDRGCRCWRRAGSRSLLPIVTAAWLSLVVLIACLYRRGADRAGGSEAWADAAPLSLAAVGIYHRCAAMLVTVLTLRLLGQTIVF